MMFYEKTICPEFDNMIFRVSYLKVSQVAFKARKCEKTGIICLGL